MCFRSFFFSLSRGKSWFLNISMKILLCSILCSLFFSPFSVKSYFLSVFHENLGVVNSLLFFLCFFRSHSVFCGFSLCVFALFFFLLLRHFQTQEEFKKSTLEISCKHTVYFIFKEKTTCSYQTLKVI